MERLSQASNHLVNGPKGTPFDVHRAGYLRLSRAQNKKVLWKNTALCLLGLSDMPPTDEGTIVRQHVSCWLVTDLKKGTGAGRNIMPRSGPRNQSSSREHSGQGEGVHSSLMLLAARASTAAILASASDWNSAPAEACLVETSASDGSSRPSDAARDSSSSMWAPNERLNSPWNKLSNPFGSSNGRHEACDEQDVRGESPNGTTLTSICSPPTHIAAASYLEVAGNRSGKICSLRSQLKHPGVLSQHLAVYERERPLPVP